MDNPRRPQDFRKNVDVVEKQRTLPNDDVGTKETTSNGTILVPQPSSSPDDPLNWSAWRKGIQLAVISFAGLLAIASPTANQLAYVIQSAVYHKTPSQLSYGGAASLAGLLVGPFFVNPLSSVFGRGSIFFWSLLIQMATQIWGAEMTQPSQYNAFIASRVVSGFFGALPSVLGAGFILDVFFLHQRGRAFALYDVVYLLGVVCSTTFSGFILRDRSLGWPWTLWWTVPGLGFAALLVFLFLEETNFDRKRNTCVRPSGNWLKRRIVTIFFGWKVVPKSSFADVLNKAVEPVIIFLAPISIIPGIFSMTLFGFAVLLSLIISIYIQTPIAMGGYGFTPERNAYFSFVSWVGLGAAELNGLVLGDTLPVWVAKRFNRGVWKPEYRLINTALPIILAPIGLGLVGASLEYHLHYMVLATGIFLITYASAVAVPFCINYIAECYTDKAVEVAVAFNAWRLSLSIGLPFFAFEWESSVGAGWEFGTAGFLVLATGLLVAVVAFKGDVIRHSATMRRPFWRMRTEEGAKLTKDVDDLAYASSGARYGP